VVLDGFVSLSPGYTMIDKAVHKLMVVAALFLVLGLVFYQWALSAFGGFLVVSESPQESDLIVVLAGDFWGGRVLTGAELGAQGYAKRVLISGTSYQNTYECDLAVRFAVSKGYSPDLFLTARHRARSTIEEALALGPELRRLGAKRILLVTSDYHSRRAALVFGALLSDLEFRAVASRERFDPSSWWKTAEGRRLLLSEYLKILGTPAYAAYKWTQRMPRLPAAP
jgi:uncharacterized SAM-binding protein YcdF (DUF218 family)